MSTRNQYSRDPQPFQGGQFQEEEEDSGSQSPPHTELISAASYPYHNRRISRRDRFRRERERTHSTTGSRDLVRLLANEEYESKQTKKLLFTAFDRLDREANRAKEAERSVQETIERFKTLNNDRIAAQQEAAKAQEELKLYKLQLENAQRELMRAQDILSTVEAQRDDAQAIAAEAKSIARRLNEERLIQMAREEGRRMGYEEGLRRGQQTGYDDGRMEGYENARGAAERVVDRVLEDETESDSEEEPDNVLQDPPLLNLGPATLQTGTLPQEPAQQITIPVTDQRMQPPSNFNPVARQSGPGSPATPLSPLPLRDVIIPPENWIPTVNENSLIQLPPPHEMQQRPPSPSLTLSRPRSNSFGSSQHSPVREFGDLTRDLPPLPPPSDTSSTSRRARTVPSRRNSNASGSTTVSRLGRDLGILSPTSGSSDGQLLNRNLGIIPEGSSRHSSPRHTGGVHTVDHIEFPVSPTRGAVIISGLDQENEVSRQRAADELRYSDPSEAEEWREQGIEETRSLSSQNRPPRARPPVLTVPAPLSPSSQRYSLPGGNVSPTRETTPRSPVSLNARAIRGQLDPGFGSSPRRQLVNDSPEVAISVEPPSETPSSSGHPGHQARDLLSPNDAHRRVPLPVTGHPPERGRESSRVSTPRISTGTLPDRRVPEMLVPNTFAQQSSSASAPQDVRRSPFKPPRSPLSPSAAVIPPAYLPGSPGLWEADWELNTSPLRPKTRHGKLPSPSETYPAAPSPVGAPTGTTAALQVPLPASSVGSPRSTASRKLHRRSRSLISTLLPTRSPQQSPTTPVAVQGSTPPLRIRRVSSNASSSYAPFDPETYNDPAFFGSAESSNNPPRGDNVSPSGSRTPARSAA